MGTMTVFLAETFPSFHFEGDYLVTLHVIDDLRFDDGLHIFADGQGVAMRQEDLAKLDFITGIARDAGDVQSLIFLDFELLSGYFHNC